MSVHSNYVQQTFSLLFPNRYVWNSLQLQIGGNNSLYLKKMGKMYPEHYFSNYCNYLQFKHCRQEITRKLWDPCLPLNCPLFWRSRASDLGPTKWKSTWTSGHVGLVGGQVVCSMSLIRWTSGNLGLFRPLIKGHSTWMFHDKLRWNWWIGCVLLAFTLELHHLLFPKTFPVKQYTYMSFVTSIEHLTWSSSCQEP